MFAIDKYLTPFLNPLGLGLALGVLAFLLVLFNKRRAGLTLLAITLIGLYGASTPFVAGWLSGMLERQYPPIPIAATPNADVIIVLGGATGPAIPPRQAPDLNEHADRLMHAADLYKAGKAKFILASGGNWRHPSQTHSEADDMRDVLMRFGVPASAILEEGKSRTTEENASFSAEILRQQHLQTALLVTSGIHMPRSVAVFRRYGVAVTPSETDIIDAGTVDWLVLDWMPAPAALDNTGQALREMFGALYYRLRGWS
ncbi:MAG TPA: YdcF family protein [Devosiaceae bacterium]|nr:YdcF family protein [Devosiaceae bacterium]